MIGTPEAPLVPSFSPLSPSPTWHNHYSDFLTHR